MTVFFKDLENERNCKDCPMGPVPGGCGSIFCWVGVIIETEA